MIPAMLLAFGFVRAEGAGRIRLIRYRTMRSHRGSMRSATSSGASRRLSSLSCRLRPRSRSSSTAKGCGDGARTDIFEF